jgi:hypothetical protein
MGCIRLLVERSADWRSIDVRSVLRIALVAVVACGLALTPCTESFPRESFRLSPDAKFILGMEGGYIWLTGEILVPAGGRPGSGTRVDLAGELGSSQGETTSVFFQGEIRERHLLDGRLLIASPAGERKITNGLRFHNKTYEPGALIESKLDFQWLELGYGYKLLDLDGWWMAPRLGVHYIYHSLTLNGETSEAGLYSNTRTLDGTFPVIGLESRVTLPLNLDLAIEAEGTHLITRGFLYSVRLGAYWSVYPDVVLTMGALNRQVHYLEDNQPLNNEWYYSIWGVSGGISFTF